MNDDERLQELQNISPEFVKEALNWWNKTADKGMKRFIIVAAYYETLAVSMEELEEDIRKINDN